MHYLLRHVICELHMTLNPNVPQEVSIHLNEVWFLHSIKRGCVLATS